jgi:hypothetical protein
MQLMNYLIGDTVHANKLKAYKLKRGLTYNEDNLDGEGWYCGFMNRNSDLIKMKCCTVQDSKRHTYCTFDNIFQMYDDVYKRMVESSVAKELDHEVMLDKDGNIVADKEKMSGRPTNYIVTKPEQIMFVDETGSNTNQKDGYAGGQWYLLPNDGTHEGVVIGDTTDIHFTTLCFTSGTGAPIMCAVILKSEKELEKLPMNDKLGVDILKDIKTGGTNTNVQIIEDNIHDDGTLCGGPVKILHFSPKFPLN